MLVFSFYLKYRLYQQIYYNYLLFFLIILLFSKFLILGKHFYKTDLKTKNFKSFYTFDVKIINKKLLTKYYSENQIPNRSS